MDNEIREKINKLLDDMLKKLSNTAKDKLSESMKEPCKIHIDKDKEGKACLEVEGKRLPLLITLCGLEKELLKYLDCDEEEFKMLKKVIGTREAEDNE